MALFSERIEKDSKEDKKTVDSFSHSNMYKKKVENRTSHEMEKFFGMGRKRLFLRTDPWQARVFYCTSECFVLFINIKVTNISAFRWMG